MYIPLPFTFLTKLTRQTIELKTELKPTLLLETALYVYVYYGRE